MVNKEGKQETRPIDHFPSQCEYALLVFSNRPRPYVMETAATLYLTRTVVIL